MMFAKQSFPERLLVVPMGRFVGDHLINGSPIGKPTKILVVNVDAHTASTTWKMKTDHSFSHVQ